MFHVREDGVSQHITLIDSVVKLHLGHPDEHPLGRRGQSPVQRRWFDEVFESQFCVD